jgi:hypothetical protein
MKIGHRLTLDGYDWQGSVQGQTAPADGAMQWDAQPGNLR